MVKYIGPRVKVLRRLGILPGLTTKLPRKQVIKSPGQHGKSLLFAQHRTSMSDDFKEQLIEKQKIRYNYCLTEKQLFSYFKKAKKRHEPTGQLLLDYLESRLDCILFRLGFAPTILAARQLINHRHILINGGVVTIPSVQCKVGDTILIKAKESSQSLVSRNVDRQKRIRTQLEEMITSPQLLGSKYSVMLPKHLKIIEPQYGNTMGCILEKIKREDICIRVNELKVLEYYSK